MGIQRQVKKYNPFLSFTFIQKENLLEDKSVFTIVDFYLADEQWIIELQLEDSQSPCAIKLHRTEKRDKLFLEACAIHEAEGLGKMRLIKNFSNAFTFEPVKEVLLEKSA